MFSRSADRAFRRFRATGDPAALARVFDATAEELLRLARHLAGGEAAAEDLLQATFVTAIESRESHDGERAVLPWLCGVLANHARAARRRAQRMPDAQRLSREVVDDPVDRATEQELRAELTHAIESLPEPYRPVLRLLLEVGLEPIEIARTLERPPGTVRAQLARGLEHLRRALPLGIGASVAIAVTPGRGLAAVREALLERIGEHAGGGTAVAAAGVFAIMTTKTLLVGTALICAAALVWFVATVRPGVVASDAAIAGAGDLRAVPVPVLPSSSGDGTRTAIDLRTAATDPMPPVSPTPRALRVRVVRQSNGKPVVGVAVRLQDTSRILDFEGITAPQLTDDHGMVNFVDPPGSTVLVHVACAGSVRAVHAGEFGDVVVEVRVPVGLRVRGRVLDATGSPVAQATVLAYGAILEPEVIAHSDATGSFVVEDVQPQVGLEARLPGRRSSLTQPIVGAPGSSVDVELRLRGMARHLTGFVLCADGSPSPNAFVAVLGAEASPFLYLAAHESPCLVYADDRGRFEADVPRDLALRIVGCPRARADAAPGLLTVAAGSSDLAVDIVLRRAAVLEGHVAGANVTNAQITAWPEAPLDDFGIVLNMIGLRATMPAADGGFRLSGLLPGHYQLTVKAGAGRATATREIAEGDHQRWDVDLLVGGNLKLTVEPAQPPAGAAHPFWSARIYRVLADGNREFIAMANIGPDGGCEFASLDTSDHEVLIGIMGTGPMNDQVVARSGPILPSTANLTITVRADQLPRSTLRGRLCDADGSPRANAPLRAQCSDGLFVSTWSVTTDQEGRFAFTPLVAGDWNVALDAPEPRPVATAPQLLPSESRDLGEIRVR